MMPHENFRLGRIFVRMMRVVTNMLLLLLSVVGIVWGCYVMVTALMDFRNNSDSRAALRQRVQDIPAERDKKNAALAGEETREARRLEQEIQNANGLWKSGVNAFNALLAETAAKVKTVAPDAASEGGSLSGEAMLTTEACCAVLPFIQQADACISQLKNGIFSGMEDDIRTLMTSVKAEEASLSEKRNKLLQENEEYAEKVEEIKSRYKDKREVITIYRQKDRLLKDHCVYNLLPESGEDVSKHARDLSSVGFMMPALVNRLTTPNYLLPEEKTRPLYTKVSRLSAWLPMLVVGGQVEERSEEEIPMNPLVLSDEDKQQIDKLEELIGSNEQKINNLDKQEALCRTELKNLEITLAEVEKSKKIVLAQWKVDPALAQVRETHERVQKAVVSMETLRETYSRKKESLYSQYEQEIKDCQAKENLLWKKDCLSAQVRIKLLLMYAAVAVACGWLLWGGLMTWLDFAAAILVAAVRAQAVHESISEKTEA